MEFYKITNSPQRYDLVLGNFLSMKGYRVRLSVVTERIKIWVEGKFYGNFLPAFPLKHPSSLWRISIINRRPALPLKAVLKRGEGQHVVQVARKQDSRYEKRTMVPSRISVSINKFCSFVVTTVGGILNPFGTVAPPQKNLCTRLDPTIHENALKILDIPLGRENDSDYTFKQYEFLIKELTRKRSQIKGTIGEFLDYMIQDTHAAYQTLKS